MNNQQFANNINNEVINQEHNKEIVIAGAKQNYCHQILEYIKEAVE